MAPRRVDTTGVSRSAVAGTVGGLVVADLVALAVGGRPGVGLSAACGLILLVTTLHRTSRQGAGTPSLPPAEVQAEVAVGLTAGPGTPVDAGAPPSAEPANPNFGKATRIIGPTRSFQFGLAYGF